MKYALRFTGASSRSVPALAALAAVLWLSACGNFWQNPYGTGGGGSTSTTTTLESSSSSVAVGASLTLTATVSPSAATGSVTFYNGSTSIGSSDLSSGTATFSTSFSSAGTESLTATYGGDSTYSSSTSSEVSVTVTASSAVRRVLAYSAGAKVVAWQGTDTAAGIRVATSAYGAAPVHAVRAFHASRGAFTARNSEAMVVEGPGIVTLTDSELSAAAGAGRGVLLDQSSTHPGNPRFSMSGGSLSYDCDAASRPSCGDEPPSKSNGSSRPATLFAVANAKAAISLSHVEVTHHTETEAHRNGTLLTVSSEPGRGGALANLRAQGMALSGDVIVDGASTAGIAILEDASGGGSTLTGAIDGTHTGKSVSLELDRASQWTVTGTSYLTSLGGLDLDGSSVGNIDGGGHCVFYSGTINGSASHATFTLSGGGYLAPAGTTGLRCE